MNHPEKFVLKDLWELASQTLETVLDYSVILENQSKQTCEAIGSAGFFDQLRRFVDGVDLFTQATGSVKKVVRRELPHEVQEVETELLQLLKVLLDDQQDGNLPGLQKTLGFDLPRNMERWRSQALPAFIRMRDC